MKRYNITVNGKVYDVAVEEVASDSAAPVVSAPAPAAAPAPAQASAAPVAEGIKVTAPMPGTVLDIKVAVGDTVEFPVVLVADEKGIMVGAEVANTKVTATVTAQGKAKKIIVFKYKAKKNERKKQGHRQPFTEVKVTAIGANKAADAKAE